MKIDQEYKYEVSLSLEAFEDKTISKAMIMSVRSFKNDSADLKAEKASRREIRKRYGYKRGISFDRFTLTSGELLEKLTEGHTVANLYSDVMTRKDGSWGIAEKCDLNFEGSWLVGVDIDETSYKSARDFISTLSLEPTFWYTTYSNQQGDNGARFRMIYALDEKVADKYYFRYVAWNINQMIQKDTDEEIKDNCNLLASQYFNGTNKNAPGIVFDCGISNKVYSFSDFSLSDDSYLDFLKHNCYYKTLNNAKRFDIQQRIDNFSSSCFAVCENKETTERINPFLVKDMTEMSYDDFMKNNRHKYHYFYRTEQEGWAEIEVEGKTYYYQPIDTEYIQLPYYPSLQQDQMKRRKKLYLRMCLRRIIMPEIDADTLLYCAYEDRHKFIDNSDGVVSIECLKKNVESCMEKDVDSLREDLKDYIESLPKPKSGIIFRGGQFKDYSDNEVLWGLQSKVIKEIRYQEMDRIFDKGKSVNENMKIMKEKGMEISQKSFYRYLHVKEIKIKLTDEDLSNLIDKNLSIRDNVKIIKDMGYRISKDRVSKVVKNNTSFPSSSSFIV